MHLELDGVGPTYEQVLKALRGAIRSGRFAAGMRLMPSRELSRALGVSRNTVTAAYERLVADGWLVARVGSGTFVANGIASATLRQQRQLTEAVPVSQFANRVRQIIDMATIPGRRPPNLQIAFQYGAPYVNPSLLSAWAAALRNAAIYADPGYNRSQGLPKLREEIGVYLARRRGIQTDPDNIIVTGGTQQGLSLCSRLLLDPGQTVALEEPHYYSMRVIAQAYGANVATVPVDRDGMNVDVAIEARPRVVFTTPAHQFPVGARLSEKRRALLLEYAAKHKAWIVEDDYDGDFRYDGPPTATLFGIDVQQRVIYLGSFSKSLFPAMRLGYVVVPPSLRDTFIAAKFLEDMGASVIDQSAMAYYMSNGGFERHLITSVKQLRRRRDYLLTRLAAAPGSMQITGQAAGMHLLATLPHWTEQDVQHLISIAAARGVGLFSVAPYYRDAPDRVGLIIGYASTSLAEIRAGMDVFDTCLSSMRA